MKDGRLLASTNFSQIVPAVKDRCHILHYGTFHRDHPDDEIEYARVWARQWTNLRILYYQLTDTTKSGYIPSRRCLEGSDNDLFLGHRHAATPGSGKA